MVKELSNLSDSDLITKILNKGDKKSLSVLYDRYAPSIFRKCLAMLNDHDASKDITHDVFVKSFLQLAKLKKREQYKFWINRITYNSCIDYLNLRKAMKTDRLEIGFDPPSDDDTYKEEKLLKEIELEQLEQLLTKLPEQDRIVLIMQYQDDMSIKEIQDVLGVGSSAVKMRIKRAKEKLLKMFNEIKYKEVI